MAMKGFVAASCGVSAAFAVTHQTTAGFLHPDAHLALLSTKGPSCRIGHSADWYNDQCKAIKDECAAKEKAAGDQYERDLSAYEEEYKRQKRILEGKEDAHAEEKEDVAAQKKVVKKTKLKVKDAKVAVKENAHCPPDLEEARKHLAELEAVPNETPEDIEAECAARKKVLALEECVEILREAEEVLYDAKEDHSGEKSELGTEKGEEDAAADEIPPQEKRVADALAAWEAAKRQGPPKAASSGSGGKCGAAELAALKDAAEQDVRDAEAEYKRQKAKLEDREGEHAEEKKEVAEQEDEVAEEKEDVAAAKAEVAKSEHCPAELDDASSKLAALQAKPNETPEDVEEECALKKKILKLEQCVADLRKAEAELSKQRIDYSDEKEELGEEQSEESHAAKQVPPQDAKVKCAKEALDSARAALEAIESCSSGGSAPAPSPTTKAAEGSASRFGSSGLIALGAAMLCALTSA